MVQDFNQGLEVQEHLYSTKGQYDKNFQLSVVIAMKQTATENNATQLLRYRKPHVHKSECSKRRFKESSGTFIK